MGIRHLARQHALQFLYMLEFFPLTVNVDELEEKFISLDPQLARGENDFARQLTRQTWHHRQELDRGIEQSLENWTLDRLPKIDLLCLRMALCEFRYFPEVPLRVTINEYIELVRLFSTDESPQYINAVLDRLSRKFAHKDFQKKQPTEESE